MRTGSLGICFCILASLHNANGSTLLTFDDVPIIDSYVVLPNQYGTFQWNNFDAIIGTAQYTNTGYYNGVVSASNVAFNPYGDPASFSAANPFDLNSAYVSGNSDGMPLRVQGLLGTNILYDTTYIVNNTGPTFINFNYRQIQTVKFVPGSGSIFILDNLSVTITNPAALFTVSPSSGYLPLTVHFTDLSVGAVTNWDWTFGDGSPHSSEQNPSHTYSTDGIYATKLTVIQTDGITRTNNMAIIVKPKANFSFLPADGQVPLTVQFTDASIGSITNWSWLFGDGAASSVQHPSHTYNKAGNFNALLIVTDAVGLTDRKTIAIAITPIAEFDAAPTTGHVPLTVQFTDQSIGAITNWDWDFADGSPHSSIHNPQHTYNTNGTFGAALIVTGTNGTRSTNTVEITVGFPLDCSSPASPPLNPGMVQGWGCNYLGQINTGCLTNIAAIAAGRDHSLFLNGGGTVQAIGDTSSSAVVVPPGLSNVISVAAGDSYSLALKSDGTVVGWGQTTVPQGLSNIVAISAGANHSLGLSASGTVIGWGTTTVPPGLSNIVAVSAGRGISLALKDDGTVVGWNLGRGADPSTLSNIVAISAGDNCCYEAGEALQSDGTLLVGSAFTNKWFVNGGGVVAISCSRGSDSHVSWGLNASGSVFAIGGFAFCGGPFLPPEGIYNAVAVASGDAHNLALIGNGPPVTHASLLNPSWDESGFHASVPTENGRVYRLEYKNSLGESGWCSLPLVAGNGRVIDLLDPTAPGNRRFYRVRRW